MILEVELKVINASGSNCTNCGCAADQHDFHIMMQLLDVTLDNIQPEVQYLTTPGSCRNYRCKQGCTRYHYGGE